MNLDLLFQVANTAAFLCWVLLIVRPQVFLSQLLLFQGAALLAFALLYLALLGGSLLGEVQGDFFSLEGVMQLFAHPGPALAGWVHYLTFDLFVGVSCQQFFMQKNTPQLIRIPVLVGVFMFGPIGYLLFRGYKASLDKA